MNTASTAKGRLLEKLDAWIEAHESDVGVSDQMNVIHAREERRLLGKISHHDAEAMEAEIIEKEAYDPAKDRFGFGPVNICPLNYIAFLNDEARQALESQSNISTVYVIPHWEAHAGLCCLTTDDVTHDDHGWSGAGYDTLDEAITEAIGDDPANDPSLTNVFVCDLTDLAPMEYCELFPDMAPRTKLLRLLDERAVPARDWKK